MEHFLQHNFNICIYDNNVTPSLNTFCTNKRMYQYSSSHLYVLRKYSVKQTYTNIVLAPIKIQSRSSIPGQQSRYRLAPTIVHLPSRMLLKAANEPLPDLPHLCKVMAYRQSHKKTVSYNPFRVLHKPCTLNVQLPTDHEHLFSLKLQRKIDSNKAGLVEGVLRFGKVA